MNILFKYKDDKNNPTNQVKEFISYWIKENNITDKTIEVLSPEKMFGRGADYFVKNTGLLIEATQLIDNQELARGTKWAITANTLSKLIKQDKNFSSIKGLYSISTPENFGLKVAQLRNQSVLNTKVNNATQEIIQSILSGKKDISIFGYRLEIEKINDKENGVYFATIGEARSISVAGTFHENIKNKIYKSNTQLSLGKIKGIKVKNKVLLIVNKYRLLTFDWELFEGISYSYSDLIQKNKNIDEIWFQVESKDGIYNHRLLYRRSVFEKLEKMKFSKMSAQDYEVFAKWFSSLEKMENKKSILIEALKQLLRNHKPHEIFLDPQTRIDIVRYGRWLGENDKLDDANWLVQQFLNDPDPLDPPTKDKEDYGNQLHESIKNADKPDTRTIHTVKGHLAWNVQLLALKKDYLKEAYVYTRNVLTKTKNLYLVLQWIFPLIEISNRRFWLKERDGALYIDFKNLCFQLLTSYSRYPDIGQGLVHVFHHFRELDSEEVKEVLNKLEMAEGYEALLLYFAIFRERHFKEQQYDKDVREYDPIYAKRKLDETILSEDKKLDNLRSGIAWNIWKILSEDDNEFKTLSPLVDKFLTTSYNNHLYHNFERIVEDCLDKYSDKCLDWFITIINSAKKYLDKNPDEGRNVWLSTETKKVLDKLAEKRADKLSGVIELLYEMWMKGAYIGTIPEIFSLYKSIPDEKLRLTNRDKFKEIYFKMKTANPKIENVEW